MKITARPFFYLICSVVIVILDQLSKWYVTENLLRPLFAPNSSVHGFFDWLLKTPDPLGFVQIELFSFFNLVMVWNKGVSFGLFNQGGQQGPILLLVLSVAISLGFVIWLFRTHAHFQSIGIALVVGGAIGNIIDRARFRAVIDFLDFHAFGYHWPAFNLADSAIVVGIGALIFYALFLEKNHNQKNNARRIKL